MRGGFSFCGVDIADIGLEYAPENKDTYVYAPGETEVHEETIESHDGGYVYGTSKKPKEFTLRCFYEDTNIAKGLMAKAYSLFKVGKSGILIFKRRPWCYYYATVTDIDTSDIHTYLNGLIVVTMKAYYPYARGIENNGGLFCNLLTDPNHNEVMQNTGLLDSVEMVPATTFGSMSVPITTNTVTYPNPILLYNPGTERAKVSIIIAGTAGNGITIYNKTTDQLCRYVAFNTSGTNYIYTDGINGKTMIDNNGNKELAFLYHDYGFIELEPSFPIKRDIYVTCTNNVVTTTNMLYDYDSEQQANWYAGKYIFLNGEWHRIRTCNDFHTLTLDDNVTASLTKTCIVKMNEVILTPTQNTSITKLSFIYKPTFA